MDLIWYGIKLVLILSSLISAIISIHSTWWGFRNIKEGIECRKEFPGQLPLGIKWTTIGLTGITLLIVSYLFLPHILGFAGLAFLFISSLFLSHISAKEE